MVWEKIFPVRKGSSFSGVLVSTVAWWVEGVSGGVCEGVGEGMKVIGGS